MRKINMLRRQTTHRPDIPAGRTSPCVTGIGVPCTGGVRRGRDRLGKRRESGNGGDGLLRQRRTYSRCWSQLAIPQRLKSRMDTADPFVYGGMGGK